MLVKRTSLCIVVYLIIRDCCKANVIFFPDSNDFNNTVIRITFDPDENKTHVSDDERAAHIALINDAVNEADEQVFIVQLRLINSTNSGAIDITIRQNSLCRITDDDRKSSLQ